MSTTNETITLSAAKVRALVAEVKPFIDCDGPDSWALSKALRSVEVELNEIKTHSPKE